jgi:hypothetical protein
MYRARRLPGACLVVRVVDDPLRQRHHRAQQLQTDRQSQVLVVRIIQAAVAKSSDPRRTLSKHCPGRAARMRPRISLPARIVMDLQGRDPIAGETDSVGT